jgi:alpha-1,6-mannosyltransferase
MRIVRLANFITPYSGGLRTALQELGAGYAAAGHEPVLVMPGAADDDEQTPQGRVITLRGPVLPLSGATGCCCPNGASATCSNRCGPTGWRSPTGPRCAGPGRGRAGTTCPR